jgi:hypothetical protein
MECSYDEFVDVARIALGHDPALTRQVWEKCDLEARQNMIWQMRQSANEADRRELAAIVAEERAKW